MKPQWLAEGNRVVLTASDYRELLERCGELAAVPQPACSFLVAASDAGDYCDECGAVPQIDQGKHAVTCKQGQGR